MSSNAFDIAFSAASLIRFVIVVLGGACIAVQLIPSQLNGSVSPRGALSAAAVTATRTTVHAPPRATQPPPIVENCGSITEGSAAENTTLAYRGAPAWCTCMKLRVGPWRMPSGEGGLTNKMMRVGTSSLETIAKREVALLPRHRNAPYFFGKTLNYSSQTWGGDRVKAASVSPFVSHARAFDGKVYCAMLRREGVCVLCRHLPMAIVRRDVNGGGGGGGGAVAPSSSGSRVLPLLPLLDGVGQGWQNLHWRPPPGGQALPTTTAEWAHVLRSVADPLGDEVGFARLPSFALGVISTALDTASKSAATQCASPNAKTARWVIGKKVATIACDDPIVGSFSVASGPLMIPWTEKYSRMLSTSNVLQQHLDALVLDARKRIASLRPTGGAVACLHFRIAPDWRVFTGKTHVTAQVFARGVLLHPIFRAAVANARAAGHDASVYAVTGWDEGAQEGWHHAIGNVSAEGLVPANELPSSTLLDRESVLLLKGDAHLAPPGGMPYDTVAVKAAKKALRRMLLGGEGGVGAEEEERRRRVSGVVGKEPPPLLEEERLLALDRLRGPQIIRAAVDRELCDGMNAPFYATSDARSTFGEYLGVRRAHDVNAENMPSYSAFPPCPPAQLMIMSFDGNAYKYRGCA